ncbi:hypothetical protein WPS_29160 [Vulcanimicrobium alpinum]|uniref:TonB-dependent receptor plug domain-containing protein n=1 Tax=Vulcanimicrobium alpinum TaxID=3016050 RepID=A0AAN1XYB5_UNVUL|nr:TonB-dependent receptor [Vulcanimicrobium alpinum]BDE07640.1 hypothetical protein WPS_29160 [Vulcanimicrobium alpinum]
MLSVLALFVAMLGGIARGGTTGSISGTIVDAATKKPLSGATVTATAPSGRATSTTDGAGFFNIYNLAPDTYTISIALNGYEQFVVAGVTVVQDQNVRVDQALVKSLREIGRTSARGASNLVQPTQTADVYNVSSKQLAAVSGAGGYRTLYDVIQTSPGVTSTGYAGRPRIRGSDVGDVAWEYDGIPINDRLTGLFTTNLSTVGTGNLEVYTGGFNAQYGNAGVGVINSVVKRGSSPSFGAITYGFATEPAVDHIAQFEYGNATKDGRWSWYIAGIRGTTDNQFANGYSGFSNRCAANLSDCDPATITNNDAVVNVHWRPNARDDIQFLTQTGNEKLPWSKAMPSTAVGVTLCNGVVVQPGTRKIINPGVSASGQPCVDSTGPTGLQYTAQNLQNANVWYHYSNLGKIQWNHVFSEKLFATFRIAENFNQYIFYQPVDNANFDGSLKPGTPWDSTKSLGNQDEYSDRRSHIYIGALDLQYTPNAHSTWYGGASYERDTSAEHYYDFCGCDDAGSGSAFNVDGSWPNLFLAVDYPLTLPSAYLGTKQTFGRATLEPSIRYDSETYHIPNKADPAAYARGPYTVSSLSPRFGAAWAFNSSTVLRGSYGITTSFVPAAYVFNNSPNGITEQDGRINSVYYPGAETKPQINHSADLALSHSLPNGVDSWRIAPFYHKSNNKLALERTYVVNADGSVTAKGPTLFKAGIVNQATGAEFGWNHVVRGDGLSWYLAGTFVNYWGSISAGTLAGGTPYGRPIDITSYAKNALVRNSSQPPVSVSWTGDYNYSHLHIAPFFNYQVGAPYNVLGNQCMDPSKTAAKCPAGMLDTQVHFARPNTWASLDTRFDILKRGTSVTSIGLNIRNLFQNQYADVYPVVNGSYPKGPSSSDLVAYGPDANLPNTLYYYSPDQARREFIFYLTTKF